MSAAATVRSIPPVRNGIGQVYREELSVNARRLELKYCELCGRAFPRAFAPTEPYLQKESDVGGAPQIRYRFLDGMKLVADRRFASGVRVFEVVRRRDHGERFCLGCRRSPAPELRAEALLTEQELYKAQLPGTEVQMRHAAHLPKFDRSLAPVGRATAAHKVKQTIASRPSYDRKAALLRADKTRALVTAAFRERGRLSLEDLQALIPECYASTQVWLRLHGIQIFPRLIDRVRRPGIKGPGMGVYILPGVSPEAVN